MEALSIAKIDKNLEGKIVITGSKSETNRLLILKQLYPNLTLENVSNSDDSKILTKILTKTQLINDVEHAGTAMRFLTAYFASQPNSIVSLTGSARMQERPIEILVNALRSLGADIEYLNKIGFPPLRIRGNRFIKNEVSLKGNVSSQYITALLLIAPKLPNGLTLRIKGDLTSKPYVEMTLGLLNQLGVKTQLKKKQITVFPSEKIEPQTLVIESDWSSASYFYSLAAMAYKAELELSSFKKDSLQGDANLVEIYKHFGVHTKFDNHTIKLTKTGKLNANYFTNLDLSNTPDIAQTIAITCFGLGLDCNLTGLHTLKIKETNRLFALKTELEKLGATVNITNNSLHLKSVKNIRKNVKIDTYNDHRMAMSFAPLALKVPITINNPEVVSKSYPNFWEDFQKITS